MIAPIIIGAVVILIAMYVMSKKPEPQKIMLNTNVVDVESPVDKKQKGSTSASGQGPGTPASALGAEQGTTPGQETEKPSSELEKTPTQEQETTPTPGEEPGPGTPASGPEPGKEGDSENIGRLLNDTGKKRVPESVDPAVAVTRALPAPPAAEAEATAALQVLEDLDAKGRYLQYLIYIAYLYHIINNKSQFNSVLETAKSIYPSVDKYYMINIVDSKSVNEIKWTEIPVKNLQKHLYTIDKVCVGETEIINSLEIPYTEKDYKKLTTEEQEKKNKDLYDKISEIPCKSTSVEIEEENPEETNRDKNNTNRAIIPIEGNNNNNTEAYDVKSQIEEIKRLVEQLQHTDNDNNLGYQRYFEENKDFNSVLSELAQIDDDNYQEKIREVICPGIESIDQNIDNEILNHLIKELKKVPLGNESAPDLKLKLCLGTTNEITLIKRSGVEELSAIGTTTPETPPPPAAKKAAAQNKIAKRPNTAPGGLRITSDNLVDQTTMPAPDPATAAQAAEERAAAEKAKAEAERVAAATAAQLALPAVENKAIVVMKDPVADTPPTEAQAEEAQAEEVDSEEGTSCKELKKNYGVCRNKNPIKRNYDYHTDKISNHDLLTQHKLNENRQFIDELNTELTPLSQELNELKDVCKKKEFENECMDDEDIPKIQERDKIIKKHVLKHFLVEALQMSKGVFSKGPTDQTENSEEIYGLHENINQILNIETDEKKTELIDLVIEMDEVKKIVTEVKKIVTEVKNSDTIKSMNFNENIDGFEVLDQIVNFLKTPLPPAAATVASLSGVANTPDQNTKPEERATEEVVETPTQPGTPTAAAAEATNPAGPPAAEEAERREAAAAADPKLLPAASPTIAALPLRELKVIDLHQQRRNVAEATAKQEEEERQTKAVTTIQAAVRGHRVRENVRKLREAAAAKKKVEEAEEEAEAKRLAAKAAAEAAAAEAAAAEAAADEKKKELIRIIKELTQKAKDLRIEPPRNSEASEPQYIYTTKGISQNNNVKKIIDTLISVDVNQLTIDDDNFINTVNNILDKIGATSCKLSDDDVSKKLDKQIDVFGNIRTLFDTLKNGITENKDIVICASFKITLKTDGTNIVQVEEVVGEEAAAPAEAPAEESESEEEEESMGDGKEEQAAAEEQSFPTLKNKNIFVGGQPEKVYPSLKLNGKKLAYNVLFNYMNLSFETLLKQDSLTIVDLKRIFVTNVIIIFNKELIKKDPCESLIDDKLRLNWDNNIELINTEINKNYAKEIFEKDKIIDKLGFSPVAYLNKVFDQMINKLKETNKIDQFNQIPEYNEQIDKTLFDELRKNINELVDESDISKYKLFVNLVESNEQIKSLPNNVITNTKDLSQLKTLVESIINILSSDNNSSITVRENNTIENEITFRETFDTHLLPLFNNYLNTIENKELTEKLNDKILEMQAQQTVQEMTEDPLTMLNYFHVIEIYETEDCTFKVNEDKEEKDGKNIIDEIKTFLNNTDENENELSLTLLKCGNENDERTITLDKDQAIKLNEKLQKYKKEQEESDKNAKEVSDALENISEQEKTINEKEEAIKKIKSLLDTLNVSSLTDLEEIMKESAQRSSDSIENLRTQLNEHIKALDEKQSRINELELEITKKNTQYDTDTQQLKAEKQQLEVEKQQLEADIEKIQKEKAFIIEQMKKENTQLELVEEIKNRTTKMMIEHLVNLQRVDTDLETILKGDISPFAMNKKTDSFKEIFLTNFSADDTVLNDKGTLSFSEYNTNLSKLLVHRLLEYNNAKEKLEAGIVEKLDQLATKKQEESSEESAKLQAELEEQSKNLQAELEKAKEELDTAKSELGQAKEELEKCTQPQQHQEFEQKRPQTAKPGTRISQLFPGDINDGNFNTTKTQLEKIKDILNQIETTQNSEYERNKERYKANCSISKSSTDISINEINETIKLNTQQDIIDFMNGIDLKKETNNQSVSILNESDKNFKYFKQKLVWSDIKYILSNAYIQSLISTAFMYLTNPFNVLIKVTNSSKTDKKWNEKINFDQTNSSIINQNLICTQSNYTECSIDNVSLNLGSDYGPFDKVFFPREAEIGNDEGIKNDTYIQSILDEFFNSKCTSDKCTTTATTDCSGKNYMIMHYGYSGTGKTWTAKYIYEKIQADSATREEGSYYVYGKLGKNQDKGWDNKDFTYKKQVMTSPYDVPTEFRYPEPSKDLGRPDKEFMNNSKLVKESLNNKESSRFHSCKVFVNENGNKLYYYDLAGFESSEAIATQRIRSNKAQLIQDEMSENATKLSIIISLLKIPLNQSKNDTKVTNNDPIFNNPDISDEKLRRISNTPNLGEYLGLYLKRKKSDKAKFEDATELTKKQMRDRLDLLLESHFISQSLKDLKAALIDYRNNTENALTIPKLGLESVKFEKIVMFGFIRNDQGYVDKPTDETFLNGTKETLQFLNDLANPTVDSITPPKGGTIESSIRLPSEPTPFQPKQLLLESANKVTESALEPLMVGGGIIDKTVKDTDRSIVIMVTFFITFLSTYMKNTLSDKGVLKNKTEEMVTLVAFYSFFTLLFASLIELGSVDTMYMVTYLLAFGIIYITLNTYQEPKKRSLIKDRIEGEVIQEYKEMDSNLLISWMMSSIGVIFV